MLKKTRRNSFFRQNYRLDERHPVNKGLPPTILTASKAKENFYLFIDSVISNKFFPFWRLGFDMGEGESSQKLNCMQIGLCIELHRRFFYL